MCIRDRRTRTAASARQATAARSPEPAGRAGGAGTPSRRSPRPGQGRSSGVLGEIGEGGLHVGGDLVDLGRDSRRGQAVPELGGGSAGPQDPHVVAEQVRLLYTLDTS